MRLALLALLFLAAASHAAPPTQVFIQTYRGRAGKQFHRTGCEDLHGVIKVISLETALVTHEACQRCFTETPALPPALEAPSDDKVAQLMEVSGVRTQLEQIPLVVAAGATQPGSDGQLPDPKLVSAITGAFRAPLLIASVTRTIRQKTRAAQVASAIEMFKSPAVMKFTQLEREASTAEAAAALPAFLKELEARPPSPLRRAAIDRFDELYGLTDMQVEIIVSFEFCRPRALMRRAPRDRRSAQNIEDGTAKAREELRATVRVPAQGAMLYAYRNAPDDELAKYLQLYESSADMSAVGAAIRAAVLAAISQASDQAGEKLVDDLPREPSPSPSPE